VVDRRRFTPDGDPREVAPDVAAGGTGGRPDSRSPAAGQAADVEPSPGGAAETPTDQPEENVRPSSSVGLADLVDLLATQAYAHLTGQGTARGRDLQSARVFIDFLSVLQDKTKGRLTGQEEKLLDDVLYQLHTLCVAPPR
jgi:hypothetical protein